MPSSAKTPEEDTSRQQVKQEIVSELGPSEINYLHDLLHNPKSQRGAEYYLSPGINVDGLLIEEDAAEDLVNNHFESTRQFLELRDTQFQEGKLSTSQIVQSLSNEDYDEEFLDHEEISKNYNRLLLIAYDAFYDHESGDLSVKFKKLLARAQIMQERSEEVYQYSKPLPLDEIDEKVDDFVTDHNSERGKGVQIWYGKSEDEDGAWLKFFKERNRYSRFVFKFREEGTRQKPDPTVTTNSVYRVATTGVTISNTEDGAEIQLSDDPQSTGMTGVVKRFFGELGDGNDTFDNFEKRTVEVADNLINTAKGVAEDSDSEDVIDSVQEEMDDIVEDHLEILENSDEVSEKEFEEIKQQVSEDGGIDVAGIGVRQDEKTGIDRLTVRSEAPLPEWGDDFDEFDTMTKSVLADVDRENLVLIFRIPEVDGESHNFFEIKAGTWTDHGGMPRDTIKNLEKLMTATDE